MVDGDSGVNVGRVMDASLALPRVLYLTHRVPFPPDKGDRIRNWNILRWLSARARVDLACMADEPVTPEARAALATLCERLEIVPVSGPRRWLRIASSLATGRTASEGAFHVPALAATIERWSRSTGYHTALASASSVAHYLRTNSLRDIPAVIDLVDLDSEKWLEYARGGQGPRAWLYALEGRRLRRLERELAAWARALVLVSEAEAALYRRFVGAEPVHAIVNGVDLEYFRPSDAPVEPGVCVFVGALDYRPNIDGISWFCREAWPEVRRSRPDAILRLVGRHPDTEVVHLAQATPGVELVGTVPDVRPHMARAAVVVAPLRIARGVQNKVLEALAMAKATVVSPQALDGLSVEAGRNVERADTSADWARIVPVLLGDADRRCELGTAGRRFVEARHEWDRCLEPLGDLLGFGLQPTFRQVSGGRQAARESVNS